MRRGALSLGLVVLVSAVAVPEAGGQVVYAWAPAHVDGGGFMTMAVASPHDPGVWLAASDVAGVFRSVDGGVTWRPPASGFEAAGQEQVASVAWDPRVRDRAYACVGKMASDGTVTGAFVRSVDGGVHWETASGAVSCAGNSPSVAGLPSPHPRSTGALVGADPAVTGRVWLATFDRGVFLSNDAGSTWRSVGLSGKYLRGLARDPDRPAVVYAAVRQPDGSGGVYRTTNGLDSVPTWKKLSGPTEAEEVVVDNGRLWVAAGRYGVWKGSTASPTLTRVGQASLPATSTGANATSVSVDANRDVWAGYDQRAPCTSGYCPTIFRSRDQGTTWSRVPAASSGIVARVGGPGGRVWRQAAHPETLLGGENHVVGNVASDPRNPSVVLVSGRAGIWRTSDGGVTWYPAVDGLTVTFHAAVAADPVRPGRVVVGASDWAMMQSLDDGQAVEDVALPADATALAMLTAGTEGSSPLYAGLENGDVVLIPSPGAVPTSLGLRAAGVSHEVLAVAARVVDGETVVLALAVRDGLWRRAGSGSWTKVASLPGGASSAALARIGTLAWASDASAVYAADRGTTSGVWRSVDQGRTWRQIASGPLTVATDPTSPGRVWLAGQDAVRTIDEARTGSLLDGTMTVDRSFSLERALLVAAGPDGTAVAATEDDAPAGGPARRVRVVRSGDGGATWSAIEDASLTSGALDPRSVAVGPGGVVHLATYGRGWWVGRP